MSVSEEQVPKKPLASRFNFLRRAIEGLFTEIYYTNLFFWLRPRAPADKSILISICAVTLIFAARRTHAAYADVSGMPTAVGIVMISTLVAAFGFCLLDPKVRMDKEAYVANSLRCCQLFAVGLVISAAVISSNYVLRWSESISYRLSLWDGFSEILWAFAFPSAVASLFVLLVLSFLHSDFRAAARAERLRLILWSMIFLIAVTAINLSMFGYGH